MAASGNDLRLRTRGVVELGRLAGGCHFELFHAVLRHGHRALGTGADEPAGGGGCVGGRIDVGSAVHVTRVAAAIKREGGLVDCSAGYVSARRNAWLHGHECGHFAADGWQIFNLRGVHCRSGGGVHRLKIRIGCGHFHGGALCADTHLEVGGGLRGDADFEAADLVRGKASLAGCDVVSAGWDVGQHVLTGPVCKGGTFRLGNGVSYRDGDVRNNSTLRVGYCACNGAGAGRLRKCGDRTKHDEGEKECRCASWYWPPQMETIHQFVLTEYADFS